VQTLYENTMDGQADKDTGRQVDRRTDIGAARRRKL
jgi:hypothetical protein